jgi:hypothetical protein
VSDFSSLCRAMIYMASQVLIRHRDAHCNQQQLYYKTTSILSHKIIKREL